MRLTPKEVTAIKEAAKAVFGPGVRVLLYGSRADDSKRGGDIDLLVEAVSGTSKNSWDQKIQFKILLYEKIGEQKIDVSVIYPDKPITTFQELAKLSSIEL